MFITIEELKSVAYDYQISDIVDNDETIVEIAIEAAVKEMRSYLSGRYDTEAIFAQQALQRNPLIVELCKDIALWQIVRLSNTDILFDKVKERYDRAVDYLDRVAEGKISPTLPVKKDEQGNELNPIKYGSMPRQQYDY